MGSSKPSSRSQETDPACACQTVLKDFISSYDRWAMDFLEQQSLVDKAIAITFRLCRLLLSLSSPETTWMGTWPLNNEFRPIYISATILNWVPNRRLDSSHTQRHEPPPPLRDRTNGRTLRDIRDSISRADSQRQVPDYTVRHFASFSNDGPDLVGNIQAQLTRNVCANLFHDIFILTTKLIDLVDLFARAHQLHRTCETTHTPWRARPKNGRVSIASAAMAPPLRDLHLRTLRHKTVAATYLSLTIAVARAFRSFSAALMAGLAASEKAARTSKEHRNLALVMRLRMAMSRLQRYFATEKAVLDFLDRACWEMDRPRTGWEEIGLGSKLGSELGWTGEATGTTGRREGAEGQDWIVVAKKAP